MLKQKEYDWKDSNIALFGSDTDRKVKKESAETEPAWKGAGESVGLRIWRIVKFKVEDWPADQHGEFFRGDSYIILNTYKEEEEIKYDVHFWIGKESTQDEYGTAAYKTVELDTLLDDKPIQHREVQGYESPLFKSYFKTIIIMKGGADTGFRRVLPENYEKRLFHVHREKVNGKTQILMDQVGLRKENLTEDDVFIFDTGDKFVLIKGDSCSADESYKAAQEIQKMKSSRPKADSVTMGLDDFKADPLYEFLKDGKSKEPQKSKFEPMEPAMFVVSDEDGSLDMDPVDCVFDHSNLKAKHSGDVAIVNTGTHVYCWVGKGANTDERKNAMSYAMNYVNKSSNPCMPITVEAEDRESKEFKAVMNA